MIYLATNEGYVGCTWNKFDVERLWEAKVLTQDAGGEYLRYHKLNIYIGLNHRNIYMYGIFKQNPDEDNLLQLYISEYPFTYINFCISDVHSFLKSKKFNEILKGLK